MADSTGAHLAAVRPRNSSARTSSARDRLLDTAAELFYKEGIHVGVDTVCRIARVSKRSMYQLFDSKDELIAASLKERTAPSYQASLFPSDDGDTPRARILSVFENMENLEAVHNFRGCPFLAAAVQVRDPDHPASMVARAEKDLMADFFRVEAERGGAIYPDLLANQLMLIFDGASARSVIQGRYLDSLAVNTATLLLDAANVGP